MVFANGMEIDVAEENDLIVSLGEDGTEMGAGIFAEAGEKLGVGAGDAGGGLGETFAVGVFADGQEDFTNRALDARVIDAGGSGFFGHGSVSPEVIIGEEVEMPNAECQMPSRAIAYGLKKRGRPPP
jgi:hypothetical protein